LENLKINIIPFQHPSLKKEFGFYKEKKDGFYPIHRGDLPNEIWDNFKTELQDLKFLYSNFSDTQDCDMMASVDMFHSTTFAKHYYTRLVYNYFYAIADAIQFNYVKDIEIWFIDTKAIATGYKTYNKYTLKVEFSGLTKSPALLLSYDGTSKIATTSIDKIDIPSNYFKTVVYKKEIFKFDLLSEEAKQNLEQVFPLLNIPIKNHLSIPHSVPKKGNRYKPYFNYIKDFEKLDNLLWLLGKIKEGSFSILMDKSKYETIVKQVDFCTTVKSQEKDKAIRKYIQDNYKKSNLFSSIEKEFLEFAFTLNEL